MFKALEDIPYIPYDVDEISQVKIYKYCICTSTLYFNFNENYELTRHQVRESSTMCKRLLINEDAEYKRVCYGLSGLFKF